MEKVFREQNFKPVFTLLATKGKKIVMFSLEITEDYLPLLFDVLHDNGYKVEKLHPASFAHYYGNPAVNQTCFICQTDSSFCDMLSMLQSAI